MKTLSEYLNKRSVTESVDSRALAEILSSPDKNIVLNKLKYDKVDIAKSKLTKINASNVSLLNTPDGQASYGVRMKYVVLFRAETKELVLFGRLSAARSGNNEWTDLTIYHNTSKIKKFNDLMKTVPKLASSTCYIIMSDSLIGRSKELQKSKSDVTKDLRAFYKILSNVGKGNEYKKFLNDTQVWGTNSVGNSLETRAQLRHFIVLIADAKLYHRIYAEFFENFAKRARLEKPRGIEFDVYDVGSSNLHIKAETPPFDNFKEGVRTLVLNQSSIVLDTKGASNANLWLQLLCQIRYYKTPKEQYTATDFFRILNVIEKKCTHLSKLATTASNIQLLKSFWNESFTKDNDIRITVDQFVAFMFGNQRKYQANNSIYYDNFTIDGKDMLSHNDNDFVRNLLNSNLSDNIVVSVRKDDRINFYDFEVDGHKITYASKDSLYAQLYL